MRDPTKGWKQGRKPEHPEKAAWLSAAEFAKYADVTARGARLNCAAGRYPGSRRVPMNGGEGWQIPIDCLSGTERAVWYRDQQTKSQASKAKPNRVTHQHSVSPNETPPGKGNHSINNAVTIDRAFREGLWAGFEKSNAGQQNEAKRRLQLIHAYKRLEQAGMKPPQILQELGKQYGKGANKTTIWRYLEMIGGQDEGIWLPLLLPDWKGKTHRAPFTEEAWEYIKAEWGRQTQPSLKSVYRRAQKLASAREWQIPSYDTVQTRIDALPEDLKTWMRKGDKALSQCYPAQKRLYNMPLHDIWCADGHKADVFVKDEAGEIFRPIVVAWMELRSRSILGYAVAKSETADLVRRALHQAITRSNALPHEVLVDNGRAFAAKENTGGTTKRNRFKVKENEVLGSLTLLNVGVIWATPGHGQAKPIERYWAHLTEMAKRSEFEKAYCGNKPDAKPEDFDKKTAVPMAVFKSVLGETIADYQIRSHTGEGMNGLSPQQVYESLIQNSQIRQPTPTQIRLCLMAAEATRLKGEEGSIQLNGNRYWSKTLSGLPRKPIYTVRYNPEDAQEHVYLYLDERFICEVPIIGNVGFRNKEEAAEHARKKQAYKKSIKQSDEARFKFRQSERGSPTLDTEDPDPETPTMPRPKIAEPVRPRLQMPAFAKQTEEEDTPLFSQDEFMEILVRKAASQSK